MSRLVKRFYVGKDFSEEEFRKWREQLVWWISTQMPNVKEPSERAEKYLLAALNGTKLDGTSWAGISNDFFKRVRQLSGFDLKKGIGVSKSKINVKQRALEPRTTQIEIPPVDPDEVYEQKEKYKQDLLNKYEHLANPVYLPKVEELSEIIVRGRMLSTEFMVAGTKGLERINKIRESLNKQVKDLMDFLEISPKLLVDKQRQTDRSDVGSLIAELESYGELWQDYERLDSLRELLQKYRQLTNTRPDGTPQLLDWELWHMTRTKPIHFECRKCHEKYLLLDGFTPEEIETALLQAQEIYGFGLEGIEGEDYTDSRTISTEVLPAGIMTEKPKEQHYTDEELDVTDSEAQGDSGEGAQA